MLLLELAKPVNNQFGVRDDGTLYYQPRGTDTREWMIRAGDTEIASDKQSLVNSVRVVYQSIIPENPLHQFDVPLTQ